MDYEGHYEPHHKRLRAEEPDEDQPTPSSKLNLLVKRVQDKKTLEIMMDELADIIDFDSPNIADDKVFHVTVLATMQSIAHTTQSQVRWQQFLEHRGFCGEILTFSCDGDIRTRNEISLRLETSSPPNRLVMCTNVHRLNDLVEIVRRIEDSNKNKKMPIVLRVYFDEFDEYAPKLRALVNQILESPAVVRVVVVTATPEKIFDEGVWKKICILNPRVTDKDDTYLSYRDCTRVETEMLPDVPLPNQFVSDLCAKPKIMKLIQQQHKVCATDASILSKGTIVFAPGYSARESHEAIANYWNRQGCNVIIINGERTNQGVCAKMYLSSHACVEIRQIKYGEMQSTAMRMYMLQNQIPEDLNAELNAIIADTYHQYRLCDSATVITGRMLVSRAQSIVHPLYPTFTHAVFCDVPSNADHSYQLGRFCGHVKRFPYYTGPPKVFAPALFHTDILVMEERADKFSSNFALTSATKEDYLSCSETRTSSETTEEARSKRKHITGQVDTAGPFKGAAAFQDMVAELHGLLGQFCPKPFHKVEGYEVSTRLKSFYKKNKDELTAEDRLILGKNFDPESFKQGGISSQKGYMIYPVYEDEESHEVMYFVRYLKKN